MDKPAGFDHDETRSGRSAAMITIELFGVPRLRAGVGLIQLEANNVGSALRGLATACPGLDGSVVLDGRVRPSYKLSLNGDRFVTEPGTALVEGDVLLLLAADVGG
jgi:molybdopterin converting factor small subunit